MPKLPCLNQNCKSLGKPHPNCRCYGPGIETFSRGGAVDSFCSSSRMHKKDCEYYSDGGKVMPIEDFIPDQEQELSAGEFVPDQKLNEFVPEQNAEIPADEFIPEDPNKYSSLEEQVKAGAEGLAEGVLGPVAPWIETNVLGVDPEDIKGRAEENPMIHGSTKAAGFVAGLVTGVGEAGLIAKGAEAIAATTKLTGIGSMALKGAIQSASFEGADEWTKSILGYPGSDPEAPVSAALINVGAAGLMGSITGGVFGLGEKLIGGAASSINNPKVREIGNKILIDLASSEAPLKKLGIEKVLDAQKSIVTYPLAGLLSAKTGMPGGLALGLIEKAVAKPYQKAVGKLNKMAVSGITHCLANNSAESVPNAIVYLNNAFRGMNSVNRAMNTIFSKGEAEIAPETSESLKEFLKEFIEGGQVDQQIQNSIYTNAEDQFARGGMVEAPIDNFAKAFPLQNTLLNTAKGRISGYLNSIRPAKNELKLPFDRAAQQKDKKRSYDNAIDLAVNPMKILDRVNKCRLTPEDMKHFTQMYPEVYRYMSKEMTKKITESQLKNEIPSYKKRQAMSLFLGVSLDSTTTPMAISTIQGMYAMKNSSPQQQTGIAKKSSRLSKLAPSSMTDSQARTSREQNRRA